MCGINGFTFVDRKLINSMNKIIKHRGPDYSGIYLDKKVTFGHNLLSIRGNLKSSKQPFYKSSSDWVLLFNGQIYNTRQICEKYFPSLINEKDLSDTEILYKLIEKINWNFIKEIQGIFAIVLYNKKENLIKLYRDQTGQKCLYYKLKDKKLYFSSEIKSLKLIKNLIPNRADKFAVIISTYLGYIPGKLTLFKGVYKIEPSQCITFNLKTNKISKEYFNSSNLNYYKNELDESVFKSLIKEHLQSNSPVVINLSGGLDSSILLHEMRNLNYDISSYTTRFDTKDDFYNSDARVAKLLSKDYNTKHKEILITKKSYLKNFKEACYLIEEPNYNISLPVYLQLSKVQGIKGDKKRVVLSGDGGDEIFGGYGEYLRMKRLRKLQFLISPFIFNLIKNKRSPLKYNLRFQKTLHLWFSFRRLGGDFSIMKRDLFRVLNYLEKIKTNYFKLYKRKSNIIYKNMLLGRIFWLANENFIRSDKINMVNSLEMRSPLSFQPFRDYYDLKVKNYINGKNNKLYLRSLYKDKLPNYVLEKKKTGWKSPLDEWYDEEFKQYLLKIISEVEDNNYIIDWQAIKNKIQKSKKWPGKVIHLYLSLAILSKEYEIEI